MAMTFFPTHLWILPFFNGLCLAQILDAQFKLINDTVSCQKQLTRARVSCDSRNRGKFFCLYIDSINYSLVGQESHHDTRSLCINFLYFRLRFLVSEHKTFDDLLFDALEFVSLLHHLRMSQWLWRLCQRLLIVRCLDSHCQNVLEHLSGDTCNAILQCDDEETSLGARNRLQCGELSVKVCCPLSHEFAFSSQSRCTTSPLLSRS
jgi:hypothetical protein